MSFSQSHPPYSLLPAPWLHLPNGFFAPKDLSQVLLGEKHKQKHLKKKKQNKTNEMKNFAIYSRKGECCLIKAVLLAEHSSDLDVTLGRGFGVPVLSGADRRREVQQRRKNEKPVGALEGQANRWAEWKASGGNF